MSKLPPANSRAGRVRFQSLKARLLNEWIDFRPTAVLVAIYAGIVLLDGLLLIGLFGLLEVLGLREVPLDPSGMPVDLLSARPGSAPTRS